MVHTIVNWYAMIMSKSPGSRVRNYKKLVEITQQVKPNGKKRKRKSNKQTRPLAQTRLSHE